MRRRLNILLPGLFGFFFFGLALPDDLTTEIPFEQFRHLIVVKISIGEFENLNFAIDTGTTTTVVTPKLAKKLGLNRETVRGTAFGRKAKFRKVLLPEVHLGSLRMEGVEALVVKLRWACKPPIDGLIGINLLRRTNLTIDFESGKVYLGPARIFGDSIPFLPLIPYVIIRAETSEGRLWLQLDSGSPATLIYSNRVLGRVHFTDTNRRRDLLILSGKVSLEEIEIPALDIGGKTWRNYTAFLQNKHPYSLATLDGVLGMSSLDFKRVSFDFQRHLFSWER